MKRFIAGPITIAISPIAQQALLHTEINSDFLKINQTLNPYQDWDSEPARELADQHAAGLAWNKLW